MTLTDYNRRKLRGRPADFVGLDNFKRILTIDLGLDYYNFWRILGFNFVWMVVNVFLHVAIGVAVALLLNRRDIIGKRLFRAFYVVPWAMPPLVVAIVWQNMFNREFGAINLSLGTLGLPSDINWLESNSSPIPFLPFLPLAFYAILLVNVWFGWPFMMVVATGALQSIPTDLYEAARVDGANFWEEVRHIMLPQVRPVLVAVTLLLVIWGLNAITIIYAITRGGPANSTLITPIQIFRIAFESVQFNQAAALSVMFFAVAILIVFFYIKALAAAPGEAR